MQEKLPIDHKYLFIVGLHRSGTTLLSRMLANSPKVAGFHRTGVPMDEGQFLQSVYPIDSKYGGPGKFAFRQKSHLTEQSEKLNSRNKRILQYQWGLYWDQERPILLEKTPSHINKTRFLQEVFTNSYFILLKRHPIPVTLATKKWSGGSYSRLIKHWLVAHEVYEQDAKFLERSLVINFENLILNPFHILKSIETFIGESLQIKPLNNLIDSNAIYFEKWQSLHKKELHKLVLSFEEDVNLHGYTMRHPYILKDNVYNH